MREPELSELEVVALTELRQGDGRYYVTQEAAFCPGIVGAEKWPQVVHPRGIPKHQGRLVLRTWPRLPAVAAPQDHQEGTG